MATQAAPVRDRRAPEERRALLLEAAGAVIAVRGFDGATVRDVARQANVSTGLLHHYFDSFPDLLAEAFAREAEVDKHRLSAAAAAIPDALPRLDMLVALYAPRADDPGWFLWFSAWSAAARQPKLRQSAERIHREWASQFEEVLAAGTLSRAFTCADPPGTTRRLMSLMDGLATQVVAIRSLEASDVARDIAIAVAAETGLAPEDFPEVARIGTGPLPR
jgi:AcrR family transcriptional regulator